MLTSVSNSLACPSVAVSSSIGKNTYSQKNTGGMETTGLNSLVARIFFRGLTWMEQRASSLSLVTLGLICLGASVFLSMLVFKVICLYP